jgi:hypothetical protein
MKKIPLDNSYVLLAYFLSPCKDAEQVQALREVILEGKVNWKELLYQANLHLCTPLWYIQLNRDGLLELLPDDLQKYLDCIYAENAERNIRLCSGLIELLNAFSDKGIDALLLKGAATIFDDLYGDMGSRMMRDLDILVKPEQVDAASAVLQKLGYLQHKVPGADYDHHHHLPGFYKQSTGVLIEIHFRVSSGHVGHIIPADIAWDAAVRVGLGGATAFALEPSWRQLHNAANALFSERAFILGRVSLLQLSEFVALTERYSDQIDWSYYFDIARKYRSETEFKTYLELAKRLMFLPADIESVSSYRTRFHISRIKVAGKAMAVRRISLASLFAAFYYRLRVPVWVWRNSRYVEGVHSAAGRILYLVKKWLRER